MRFGVEEGLQKLWVAGGLVASQTGLFVGDELRYERRLGDSRVRVLNQVHSGVGSPDLHIQSPGNDQECEHRQQEDLPQDLIELTKIHWSSASIASYIYLLGCTYGLKKTG